MNAETAEISDWRDYPSDDGLSPLLGAALDLFITKGYHGTSIRMIAERAKMTVPGLYYHFDSKSSILLELVSRAHTELRQRADAALADAGPRPQDRFVAFVENIILFVTNRWRLSLIPLEIDSLEGEYARQHVQLRAQIEELLLEIVFAGVASGTFKSPNPRGDTRAVLVLCRGVAQWYDPKGEQLPEQVAREYIRHSLAIVRGNTRAYS